jgi:hypothetical protein
MEEVRRQLAVAVKHIPDDLIGKPPFLGAHSIGGLVLHIGEAEWFWMKMVVSGHKLTDEDQQAPYWDILDDVERVARNGYTVEFCLNETEKIRNLTRDVLFGYNDKDLERIITFELGFASPDRSRVTAQGTDFDVEATDGVIVF